MNSKANYHEVAKAIRMEFDTFKGDLYLVFKVTDKNFADRVKANWSDDIPLQMIDKSLALKKEIV